MKKTVRAYLVFDNDKVYPKLDGNNDLSVSLEKDNSDINADQYNMAGWNTQGIPCQITYTIPKVKK